MSTPFTQDPIRIACDVANPIITSILDINDANTPAELVRGDDWQFDIGLFEDGEFLTALVQSGAGGILSATLQLYARENDTNPPVVAVNQTVLNTALTQSDWNAGGTANSHFSFVVPNANTAISLGGLIAATFWLRIFITTTDATAKQITILGGSIKINDGPISAVSSVPPAYFRLYPVAGNIVPQVYDPVSGHYYNLEIDTFNGVRSLSLGDTAY